MRTLEWVTGALLLVASPALADAPQPAAILKQMKAWLSPITPALACWR